MLPVSRIMELPILLYTPMCHSFFGGLHRAIILSSAQQAGPLLLFPRQRGIFCPLIAYTFIDVQKSHC